MALRFEFSIRARFQLIGVLHRIAERSPERAVGWSEGLKARLETLNSFPNRCPVAPEFPDAANPVREITYGRGKRSVYRIFFRIEGDVARIVSIRNSLENFQGFEAEPERPEANK